MYCGKMYFGPCAYQATRDKTTCLVVYWPKCIVYVEKLMRIGQIRCLIAQWQHTGAAIWPQAVSDTSEPWPMIYRIVHIEFLF